MNEDRNSRSNRTIIGITMGDAAGIGPEIVIKSVVDGELNKIIRPVLIGDRGLLERTGSSLGIEVAFAEFNRDNLPNTGEIEVVDLGNLPKEFSIGEVSPETGKAAGEFIEKAVELWKNGEIDAISTAPINKLSLGLGGYEYPGHTEFIAALTETKDFAMSFFAGDLRVVLLSTHLSLKNAIGKVKTEPLVKLIEFTSLNLASLLGRKIKIAVAGVNPHASENGMFGSEESDEIEPAINACVKNGIEVSGPFSPDTIFLRGYKGEFDAVIACYHDQATIAVKCLSFGTAVNVTLGLPLIRTSVDHGTAFDIAGKGIADASSMSVAIKLAGELAATKII
ncbi:MAG: 4-hydroxythreonine-4-phosphate dehydrogenase PdxA [Pyrinomonadaceae bacterium]